MEWWKCRYNLQTFPQRETIRNCEKKREEWSNYLTCILTDSRKWLEENLMNMFSFALYSQKSCPKIPMNCLIHKQLSSKEFNAVMKYARVNNRGNFTDVEQDRSCSGQMCEEVTLICSREQIFVSKVDSDFHWFRKIFVTLWKQIGVDLFLCDTLWKCFLSKCEIHYAIRRHRKKRVVKWWSAFQCRTTVDVVERTTLGKERNRRRSSSKSASPIEKGHKQSEFRCSRMNLNNVTVVCVISSMERSEQVHLSSLQMEDDLSAYQWRWGGQRIRQSFIEIGVGHPRTLPCKCKFPCL